MVACLVGKALTRFLLGAVAVFGACAGRTPAPAVEGVVPLPVSEVRIYEGDDRVPVHDVVAILEVSEDPPERQNLRERAAEMGANGILLTYYRSGEGTIAVAIRTR